MNTRRALLGVAGLGWMPQALLASPLDGPPAGYALVGERVGVPGRLLFAVAMQESQMRFGKAALPFPWTLCVRGAPSRFESKDAALTVMKRCLGGGVTNVDCGAMQVNWHWHGSKFSSVDDSLEPYVNLTVGAFILRKNFERSKSWFEAVGKYHNERDTPRAQAYARRVFSIYERLPG